MYLSNVVFLLNLHHHLLSETQLFVDKLFEAINNKSYLPQPEQPSASVKVEKDEPKKEEVMLSLSLSVALG